ncbi:MAG: hypothetical protein H7Y17_00435 [Chlorobia bacterium]|nr:hypothetical protein [Fimbriimonadaceae bacterium]
MGLFQRIFQTVSKPPTGLEAEFRVFQETFRLSPDRLFFDYLREEGIINLIAWLDHANPVPEATAFVRLANDATQRGVSIWDQSGITMTIDGDDSCGAPTQHSQDCLSVLAQILGFTITAYYREEPGSDLMKMEFHA